MQLNNKSLIDSKNNMLKSGSTFIYLIPCLFQAKEIRREILLFDMRSNSSKWLRWRITIMCECIYWTISHSIYSPYWKLMKNSPMKKFWNIIICLPPLMTIKVSQALAILYKGKMRKLQGTRVISSRNNKFCFGRFGMRKQQPPVHINI